MSENLNSSVSASEIDKSIVVEQSSGGGHVDTRAAADSVSESARAGSGDRDNVNSGSIAIRSSVTNSEGKEITQLQNQLSGITVSRCKGLDLKLKNEYHKFPDSYKSNTPKELLILGYAENFRRQYVHLYKDRKPLLLSPFNECECEKFVCTTLNQTSLQFEELYEFDKCAAFVADCLNYVPLHPPTELPRIIQSPSTVLEKQKGNCFEYSFLLCSLLLGAGYDTYVVCGYATKAICLMDESKEICPLLQEPLEVDTASAEKPQKKYAVKPPKDLRSKFEINQLEKKIAEARAKEEKLQKERAEKAKYKPELEELYGLRIHSWVLVLAGKREVPESFLIEPLTGLAKACDDVGYLGIESIWNNKNYWVNMQDCSHGLKDVVYDLGDCTKWEFMFPSNEKPVLQMSQSGEQLADMADEEEFEEVEKFIDMPHSWSQPLQITRKEFQLRCPHGKKTVLYKRAKLEKYTPYLLSDGMVAKLYIYKDDEMHSLSITREFYENRIDHLERRQHNMDTGFVTEYFKKGKKNALREHYYKVRSQGPESERTMIFDSHMRVDGLVRREELATEMTEHYVESTDFLVYKHTKFGKRVKIFGPSSKSARPISCIEEKFKRNPERSVSTNLALREFDIASDTIRLTYHHEPDCVTAATQEFIKPPNLDEKRDGTVNLFEYLSSYQPDPHAPKPTNLQLYQQLDSLIKEEWKAQARVRDSEAEVIEILNERRREEARTELDISIYDVERNEKARKQRLAQVQQEKEDKNREREMDTDYLAPFLTRFSSSEGVLKRSQALRVKDECLQDLKQRLIDKANLIQSRFEQETNELQKKQQWYQQCQTSMSKEDEEEYLSYCSASMFRIHILEHRLNKHKELAPQRYMALEQKLRNDARLADLL